MRERKFRMWDRLLNKMILNPILDNSGTEDFQRLNDYLENIDENYMEYTGQKDKDGIEIWEGDIVVNYDMKESGEIEWLESSSAFCIMDGCNFNLTSAWQLYQVIGNIYENPELRIIKNEGN